MVAAHNDEAVRRLRELKHREEKPFALMFPSLPAIKAACEVSPLEERLLRSPEAPIVLLRRTRNPHSRNPHSALSASLAPGNPNLGVMLPYTPLHHLLLSALGFPVVATSGNLSDEPICTDEHEALERLGGIADLFLVHNRPIVRHVDDSIVRVMMGRELVLRRARGYAPLPIQLPSSIGNRPIGNWQFCPRRRRPSEEHHRALGGSAGLHQPAHRRPGNRPGQRSLSPGDCRLPGPLRIPPRHHRRRRAPRLPLHQVRPRPRSWQPPPAGSLRPSTLNPQPSTTQRPTPHRPRPVLHGRERTRASRPRRLLGRHRLRPRRHGLGRRVLPRHGNRLRARGPSPPVPPCPAATRR